MKKKNTLLFFVICMFLFISSIKANDTYNIECESATVGEPFTCEITTSQPVYVYTNLQVYEGSTKVSKDSSITFKANYSDNYDIALVSEDGSTTYKTITINVKGLTTTTKTTTTTTKARSTNNFLSTITIDGEEIDSFSRSTTKYFIEVENDVTRISLGAEAEDDSARVEIDGPNTLDVGDNEYTISVTSEDDTTKFYKVIVTRLDEEASSNTSIRNIEIRGYDLDFNRNSKTFYLKINGEDTELDIEVTLNDENASYEIEGNENLKDGSEIRITVTAEDDSTDTYRIIIQKDDDTNYLPIIVGVLLLVIIIVAIIIVIVVKKKNKKNNKSDGKNSKNKNNKDAKKVSEDKKADYNNEKTIEMPPISNDENLAGEQENEDDDMIHIDNDEEETRMLSYAERLEVERMLDNTDNDEESNTDEELEKTKTMNLNNEIDKAFDDTFN
jgi:hypothetical protein